MQRIQESKGTTITATRVAALRHMARGGTAVTVSARTLTELLDLWDVVHGGAR
jgi:hypothetical protein